MLQLQKGRQAFTGFWFRSFVGCQENFLRQFWLLSLRRRRESDHKNVDILKPEHGLGVLDFKNKHASFKFLQTSGLRNCIAKLPVLKEKSNCFFFVWRWNVYLKFCRLNSSINDILRVLLHINLAVLMHIMFTSKMSHNVFWLAMHMHRDEKLKNVKMTQVCNDWLNWILKV